MRTSLSFPLTRALRLLALASIFTGTTLTLRADVDTERKASLIFSFIKNTEWTQPAKADNSAPLIIGVYDANQFADALKEYLKSTPMKSREAIVRVVKKPEEAVECHVLFARPWGDGTTRRLLKETSREGVLTIGDSQKFLELGGIIQFVKKPDGRIGYLVNVDNAKRDGLRLNFFLIRNQYQDPTPPKPPTRSWGRLASPS